MRKKYIKIISILVLVIMAFSVVPPIYAATTVDVYVDDITNVDTDDLKDIIEDTLGLPALPTGYRCSGGSYKEATQFGGVNSFSFEEGISYKMEVFSFLSWKTRGYIYFHQRSDVAFALNENPKITYADGMGKVKEKTYNALIKGNECVPNLTINDVTIYFWYNNEWVEITDTGKGRHFGTVTPETVVAVNTRKSDNWSDKYKTTLSDVVQLTIEPPQTTHIDMVSEIPPILIGSNYQTILNEYMFVAREDGTKVEGSSINFTVNDGKNMDISDIYAVKGEYKDDNGLYFPTSIGGDGSFFVPFVAGNASYTAKIDKTGLGSVQIETGGSSEAFEKSKTIPLNNGFDIIATPTSKSGYYTSSIVAKKDGKIVAKSQNENALSVSGDIFEDGDICTVYVTFSPVTVAFSKYIRLHNKIKMTEGASEAQCRQAVFDEAYIGSRPMTLSLGDVSMKVDRGGLTGYTDFKNHSFGKGEREEVKIYYKYDGKDYNSVVNVSFFLYKSVMTASTETIVLQEGQDYNAEIRKFLSIKYKDGDEIQNSSITCNLNNEMLNRVQNVTATYGGITGDTEGCEAPIKVKIIPNEIMRVNNVIAGEEGITVNFENYGETICKDAILAGYDESGQVCALQKIPAYTFEYGKTAVIFNNINSGFNTYKFFIWDSIESMRPHFMKIIPANTLKQN